jgi:hypothetical protein
MSGIYCMYGELGSGPQIRYDGLGCIWVRGEGATWFYEGVKDFIGKDDMVVL